MLAAVLCLLALAGGCAVTYFVMDAPRRKALDERARIEASRRRLDGDIREHRQEEKRQRLYEKDLDSRDDTLMGERRKWELAKAEFERRVIAYSTLEGENRILRADLANAAVHAAHLEHRCDSGRLSESVVEGQLGAVGKAYFDEVAANARGALSMANYIGQKNRVRAVATRLREIGFEVPQAEEQRALSDLHALYLKAIQTDSDRKEQAKIKELMRDEQRRLRESQEAIEQAEREKAAIRDALDRALRDVGGRHAAEIEALTAQLAEAEAKSQKAKSNAEQGIKAGNVYVISNIGSFGEGVYKIGMTRRTEPLDRVKELGDASVPFPFDVHMMIRCDDAPKLESALHRAFNTNRLNKVNPRREFFRAEFAEILALVRREHGEVAFVAEPEAAQYRNGLTMSDEEMAEIDDAFEEAVGVAENDEPEA